MPAYTTKDGKNDSRDDTPASMAMRVVELSKLINAVPPHAVEAEMSLIGSMLLEPKSIADVVPIVKSGRDFHRPGQCPPTSSTSHAVVMLDQLADPAQATDTGTSAETKQCRHSLLRR